MAQKLIVEGNDAIALAAICIKRGLKPPVGYETSTKFKKEFVLNAGGFEQVLPKLAELLDNASMTNIGLVVDANTKGAIARWQEVRHFLSLKNYSPASLVAADRQSGPKIVHDELMPTIGLWIMPDNLGNGYLEHFLAALVSTGDPLLAHAKSVVADIVAKPFNKVTEAKLGKAELHTWLAWQGEPGKPFGTAIESGYFDTEAEAVGPFLDWFAQVFLLNE